MTQKQTLEGLIGTIKDMFRDHDGLKIEMVENGRLVYIRFSKQHFTTSDVLKVKRLVTRNQLTVNRMYTKDKNTVIEISEIKATLTSS